MRRTRAWLVAGTIAGVAAGCGGGPSESNEGGTTSPSSDAAASQKSGDGRPAGAPDAPKGFDKAKGVTLKDLSGDNVSPATLPMALVGSKVISYESDTNVLHAQDAAAPDKSWTLEAPVKPPEGGPRHARPMLPPLVSEDGKVVYAAYNIQPKLSSEGGKMVVLAVDAESGKLIWSRQLSLPSSGGRPEREVGGVRQVVGSQLFVWSDVDSDEAQTWTLDAKTGEPGWEYPYGVIAANDAIGTAVDIKADRTATVIGLADGKPLGTVGTKIGKFEVVGSSDAGVLATTNDEESGGDETSSMLLDPKTGAVTKKLTGGDSVSGTEGPSPICTQIDGKDVVVCAGDHAAKGIDVRTGKVVWDLFADAENTPTNVTQFHGQVYAVGGDHESPTGVVIDGQTGKEIAKDGIPVNLVNEVGGLLATSDGVTWFPATP